MAMKRTHTFPVMMIGFLLTLAVAVPVLPQDTTESGDMVFFTENAANPFQLDLYTANADGSNRRSLATTNEDFEIGVSLSWSPDGEQIVFEAREGVGSMALWVRNENNLSVQPQRQH